MFGYLRLNPRQASLKDQMGVSDDMSEVACEVLWSI